MEGTEDKSGPEYWEEMIGREEAREKLREKEGQCRMADGAEANGHRRADAGG